MKKKKVVIRGFLIIVVALLLEAGILKYVNDKDAYRTSKVLVDRVVTVLNKNEENRSELIQSLKDDYIVRAKFVSYIVDAKPQVEYDVAELTKIADARMYENKEQFYRENGVKRRGNEYEEACVTDDFISGRFFDGYFRLSEAADR